MKTFYITFVAVLCAMNALSQSVQGHVYEIGKDSSLVPLPGVNVYWLGTNIGTQTGSDGRFVISPKNGFDKLIFSYIGYTADTVIVKTKTLDVVLKAGTKIAEVTITGGGQSYYSKMATIQVQQINSGELRKAACCNLSESFSTNASVDVNYTDAVSGAKQIELLGLAGKYSQIMIEKMPQVRGLSSNFGLGYIPGSWMESIQVSKGTASVIDGFESTTGQINVEFKKPSKGEKAFINLYTSDAGKREANADTRFKLSDKLTTSILAHGELYTQTHDMNHDGFIDMPGVQQYHIMNRWQYLQPSGFEAQFGIKALGEHRWGGQNDYDGTYSPLHDSLYGIRINTNRIEAFSKTGYIFAKEATSLGFINNVSHINQESEYGHTAYDASQNSWYSNLMYESFIGNTFHKYTTGASFIYDNYRESLKDVVNVKKEYTPGLFFQYTYTHLDKYVLMAGIRADYSNLYGIFYTPRLHFKYTFSNSTILRLSAGKGYRSPNPLSENSNLLASSRAIIIANDIKMENAWNYGITLSRDFKIAGKKVSLYGEYYRTDFINQVVTDIDANASQALIHNNNGASFSNNYQLEMTITPIKRLELLVAYRLSDVRANYNGSLQERPLINNYKALSTLSYFTNMKKWQFDITAQFNGGGRLPDSYILPGQSKAGGSFSSYTMINGQITKNFRSWSLYTGVENALDFRQTNPIIGTDNPFGKTFDSSVIWGPIEGRMVYAGVRIVFNEFFE